MLDDVRDAARALARPPGFAVSAILALALGIGANTAVFSVVYAVLLKPLPYAQPEQLVELFEDRVAAAGPDEVSIGTFADWRARTKALEGLSAYSVPFNGETLWTVGDSPQAVKTATVSPSLFSLLRVQPIAGQPLRPEDVPVPAGAVGQFVISYGFWQRAFGGDPGVIGRRVMVEGRLPREIVGIMPRGFDFPSGTDAWTSMPIGDVTPARRRSRAFQVVGRLAAGQTVASAHREIAGLSAQMAQEQPESNAGWTGRVDPLGRADADRSRLALLALLASVGGVLLIGCANVANLLIARSASRSHEMAVRAALGASPARLFRQCLVEVTLLAIAGVSAGLVVGAVLTRLLVWLAPPDITRLSGVAIAWPVLLFAVVAGVMSTLLTGIAPALQAARADRQGALVRRERVSTAVGARLRQWLIAVQAIVVVVLLTSAMLFLRTFIMLRGVDLGFHPGQIIEVETRWPVGQLFQTPGSKPWPRIQRAVDSLVDAIASVPGVEAVGLVTAVPLTTEASSGAVWLASAGAAGAPPPADPAQRWTADFDLVTPGYFRAMGIPLLRGRGFTDADRFTDAELNGDTERLPAVVVVNAAFAARYFPGGDPVGHAIVAPDLQAFGSSRTIVGVVGAVRGRGVGRAPEPAVYIPHAQHPDVIRPSFVVRVGAPSAALAAAIRARITESDPRLLILRLRPMDEVISGALSRPRFHLLLLGAFAFVALVLAAIGIHGVLACLVTQRTREIGIRIALGSDRGGVVRLVLRDALTPVLAGAAAGLALAVAATRAIASLLFGVTPLDPVSLVAGPAILTLVALAACYLPARRATAVDPLVALRDE